MNIYRMADAWHNRSKEPMTATEVQEQLIRARKAHTIDTNTNIQP